MKDEQAKQTVVVGMSGGKDSFVVAKLCVEAIGKENVWYIPSSCNESKSTISAWF